MFTLCIYYYGIICIGSHRKTATMAILAPATNQSCFLVHVNSYLYYYSCTHNWLRNKHLSINYFNVLIVYKGLNGFAPNYTTTCTTFTWIIDCHGISTCNGLAGNLTVPKPNVEWFRQSLCFTGAHAWNSLPIDVRESQSLYTFKRRYEVVHHN